MCNALKLFVLVLLCAHLILAQDPAPSTVAKPAVLQRNEGEHRTRRPREGVASPTNDFILKIGRKTNGSKHLLVVTEEIPPGGMIPKHKHLGEEEILLIQTGNPPCVAGRQRVRRPAGRVGIHSRRDLDQPEKYRQR
jgi:hypothetical protein